MSAGAPVSIAFDVAARHLEETIGAVVGDNLLCYTPRTTNLVAFDTVEEIFERVQAEVGARGARVKGGFIVVGFWWQRRGRVVVTMAGEVGWIGTWAQNVCVWIHGSHHGRWRSRCIPRR